MKVNEALRAAQSQLEAAGISTARLDALVLLEDILNTNRTQILAEPDSVITEVEQAKLADYLHKRAQHVPLAYIRHKTEFYGRMFYVDEHVLEPRPESETMIELCKELTLATGAKVADIGTGSGALGLTIELEIPGTQVDLIDIDAGALRIATKNAQTYAATARCLQADLLADNREPYDVLLCNLPYVPDNFQINRAASHEPAIALFGGPDGLDPYRRLFAQLQARTTRPQHIFTESLPPQHETLVSVATGYKLAEFRDFIQHFVAL
jgi:release factor glutamine methyltransferase